MNDMTVAQNNWTHHSVKEDFSGVVNNQGLAHIIATQLKLYFGDGIKGQSVDIINQKVLNLASIDGKFARTLCEFFLIFDFRNVYLNDTVLQNKVYKIIHSI